MNGVAATDSMEHAPWDRACLALHLLCIDPIGLGGITVRARAGPAREAFTSLLDRLAMRRISLHPKTGDDLLFGGIDVARTLAAGKLAHNPGLLSQGGVVIVPMAERCSADFAARLALSQDSGMHCLILLDEGAEPEEAVPTVLSERLAFHIDLGGIAFSEAAWPGEPDLREARDRYRGVVSAPGDKRRLVELAACFGIHSLRAPMLALRVARAHAALSGRSSVEETDMRIAAELVYPHRATIAPQRDDQEQTAPPEDSEAQAENGNMDSAEIPDDLIVAAVKAMLPEHLLDSSQGKVRGVGPSGTGAGLRKTGNRRGRPLPARPGRIDGRNRIDLLATLKAAAPWQVLRGTGIARHRKVVFYPSDLRQKRFEEHSDRVLIFVVDASGSTAVTRLAEAKGAVELLLAQSYARRDQVALIGFRGTSAELLLSPTRSLVQAKRCLAAMPGGGGTPLANGLHASAELAMQERRKGLTSMVVLLTDGRTNVALNGAADRAAAYDDAMKTAAWLRGQIANGVVLDAANRPGAQLQSIAQAMGAKYIPLPRADAQQMSAAIRATGLG